MNKSFVGILAIVCSVMVSLSILGGFYILSESSKKQDNVASSVNSDTTKEVMNEQELASYLGLTTSVGWAMPFAASSSTAADEMSKELKLVVNEFTYSHKIWAARPHIAVQPYKGTTQASWSAIAARKKKHRFIPMLQRLYRQIHYAHSKIKHAIAVPFCSL